MDRGINLGGVLLTPWELVLYSFIPFRILLIDLRISYCLRFLLKKKTTVSNVLALKSFRALSQAIQAGSVGSKPVQELPFSRESDEVIQLYTCV